MSAQDQTYTYNDMVTRINATPELEPYREQLTADWPEGAEHYAWACTATVEEIAIWAAPMIDA
jgi:hypothetical protein